MTPDQDIIRRPLDGVKVVEAGIALAGPFTGSILADQGARVVKVERPDGGDPARLLGPSAEGESLWWGVASRDKLCVALDLKAPEGRARFLDLIEEADVLVENYRPGVLERLGLGWPVLLERNPRLVGLSISGFGQTGPNAGYPGFGKIAECLSGLLPVTGRPDSPPLHVGFSLADTAAGLMGAMAVNMALYHRDCAGGGGLRIDLALYEPLLRMLELQFSLFRATGASPHRTGANDPYGWGAPDKVERRFSALASRDGAEILVLIDADSAPAIADLAGLSDGADLAALETGLAAWAERVDLDEAREALRARGIEAARVHDGLSIARDPYFLARGDVVPAPRSHSSDLMVPGHIPRGPRTSRLRAFRPARVGENNAEVFGEAFDEADSGTRR